MRAIVGLFISLSIAGAGLLAGCTPEPITLKKIGEACVADGDCGKMLCSPTDKLCTLKCTGQLDCPAGFDCGYAHADDAKPGAFGASCYKRTIVNPDKGGYGTDCSTYSPDPKSGTACDAKAVNPCADGFTCVAKLKCDADAVCSKECDKDTDCPTTMFCSTGTGTDCKDDSDCTAGFSCDAVPGGKGKVCTGRKWCAKRTQCAPCATDDECPLGYACAADGAGNRYCGRLCDGDENCPQPAPSTSDVYYSCVAGNITVGSHVGANVCVPRQGACFGKAPDGISAEDVCMSCRPGIPSDCGGGYCASFLGDEHFCTRSCQVKISGGNASGDTCPDGTFCLPTKANACGAGCYTGLCVGDSGRQIPTCWPG